VIGCEVYVSQQDGPSEQTNRYNHLVLLAENQRATAI